VEDYREKEKFGMWYGCKKSLDLSECVLSMWIRREIPHQANSVSIHYK
jgi:hypothetical protein